MLHNAMWGEDVKFPDKKRYEGVPFNVISVVNSVTRRWVGIKFPEKTL